MCGRALALVLPPLRLFCLLLVVLAFRKPLVVRRSVLSPDVIIRLLVTKSAKVWDRN